VPLNVVEADVAVETTEVIEIALVVVEEETVLVEAVDTVETVKVGIETVLVEEVLVVTEVTETSTSLT
jgi:hypothetical protein